MLVELSSDNRVLILELKISFSCCEDGIDAWYAQSEGENTTSCSLFRILRFSRHTSTEEELFASLQRNCKPRRK